MDGLCKRFNCQRFGKPRNAFQQKVTVGKHADKQSFQHLFLTNNGLSQFKVQQLNKSAFLLYFFIDFTNVHALLI